MQANCKQIKKCMQIVCKVNNPTLWVVFLLPLKGGEDMRIEIRNDSVVLDGYINAVGRESRVLPSPKGRFKEEIAPKTFERALQKTNNVDLLFNHMKERKLGSTSEGSLELYEDSIGLRGIATVSDPEVMEKAKSGTLKGWSFGFISNIDDWSETSEGIQKRMVKDLDLLEVSILDKLPAYVATSIEMRGEDSLVCEQRADEIETRIIDNSNKEEKNQSSKEETKKASNEETKKDSKEEKNEKRSIDYSLLDHEITILKMKGSITK
jgi:HK97 family phage prohead protease